MDWTNPFAMPGRWLKGNLHTHTTRSDGRADPDERIAAYRAAGYDFLALTDHFVVSTDAAKSTDEFLVIDGVECHTEEPETGETYHVVGLNVPPDAPLKDPMTAGAIKAALLEAGAMVVLAHPYWSGNTVERALELVDGMFALEVFNAMTRNVGKSTARVHWDDLLDRGARISGVAVDDSHGTEREVFKGWVMVKAASLDAASVLGALGAGAFYATAGPRIEDVAIENGRIRVCCSPAASVTFVAQRYHGRHYEAPPGGRLHEMEHALSGEERYVRIEVTDAHGRMAWTNPIYFD